MDVDLRSSLLTLGKTSKLALPSLNRSLGRLSSSTLPSLRDTV